MSKLIARTVSRLHNEEDVIEIISLEGEAKLSSLELESLKVTDSLETEDLLVNGELEVDEDATLGENLQSKIGALSPSLYRHEVSYAVNSGDNAFSISFVLYNYSSERIDTTAKLKAYFDLGEYQEVHNTGTHIGIFKKDGVNMLNKVIGGTVTLKRTTGTLIQITAYINYLNENNEVTLSNRSMNTDSNYFDTVTLVH